MKTRPPLPSAQDLLARLVRCPSTGGAEGSGEAALAAILMELLEPWADEVSITEAAPGRVNLVARFDGRDTSKSYALEAHGDTVGTTGMGIDPFGAEVRGGRLYGRGACDTKGPMTSMLLALLRHLRDHGRPPSTWLFVSTCDEELGALGARHLLNGGFRCDGMVVGEPTLLQPVDGHKGVVRHCVKVAGIAAHSCEPEQGANAVHAASDFILAVERAVAGIAGMRYAERGGPPTFSAGVIRGGSQVNLVPDDARIQTDFRLPAGMSSAEAEKVLTASAAEVALRRDGIRFDFDAVQNYPAFSLPEESAFRRVIAHLAQGGWRRPVAYATNAGFFSQAGIPCVVFGPGDIAQAHTSDEWIALDQVEQAAVMLGRVIATAG